MKRIMLLWRCSKAKCRICYDVKLITSVSSVNCFTFVYFIDLVLGSSKVWHVKN